MATVLQCLEYLALLQFMPDSFKGLVYVEWVAEFYNSLPTLQTLILTCAKIGSVNTVFAPLWCYPFCSENWHKAVCLIAAILNYIMLPDCTGHNSKAMCAMIALAVTMCIRVVHSSRLPWALTIVNGSLLFLQCWVEASGHAPITLLVVQHHHHLLMYIFYSFGIGLSAIGLAFTTKDDLRYGYQTGMLVLAMLIGQFGVRAVQPTMDLESVYKLELLHMVWKVRMFYVVTRFVPLRSMINKIRHTGTDLLPSATLVFWTLELLRFLTQLYMSVMHNTDDSWHFPVIIVVRQFLFCAVSCAWTVPATMKALTLVSCTMQTITVKVTPLERGAVGITEYQVLVTDVATATEYKRIAFGQEDINPTGEYTVGGLKPNTRYKIQIRAKNYVGSGPWSPYLDQWDTKSDPRVQPVAPPVAVVPAAVPAAVSAPVPAPVPAAVSAPVSAPVPAAVPAAVPDVVSAAVTAAVSAFIPALMSAPVSAPVSPAAPTSDLVRPFVGSADYGSHTAKDLEQLYKRFMAEGGLATDGERTVVQGLVDAAGTLNNGKAKAARGLAGLLVAFEKVRRRRCARHRKNTSKRQKINRSQTMNGLRGRT